MSDFVSHLTKNDRNYVPSYEDLGMDEVRFNFHMASDIGNKLYDEMVIKWMNENCQRIDRELIQKRRKAAKKIKKLEIHWYNTLDASDILSAIEKTRVMADECFEHVLKTQTKQSLIDYYIKLKINVLTGDIVLKDADLTKLKRFPKYNKANNTLFGSKHTFVALWSHVFSLRK